MTGDRELEDDLRLQCLPFYFLVDVSDSMTPYQDLLNQALANVYEAVRDHPRVSELARVSVILFSTQAHLVRALNNLEHGDGMLKVACGGVTNYGSAFDTLREHIDLDVDQLKAQGITPIRPIVFMLTDGLPSDRDWESAFRRLADHEWGRHPHVIAWGVGQADRHVISKVTTVRGFIAKPDTDLRATLTEALDGMLGSVVASTAAGRLTLSPEMEGFDSVEPQDDLISYPREYLD